jgi:hypothetical protein
MSSRDHGQVSSDLSGKRIIVAGLLSPRADAASEIDTLVSHLHQLGATVVATLVQRRGVSRTGRPGGARAAHLARPLRHSTYIGAGKTHQLQRLCTDVDADIVVFFNPLGSSQRSTLEKLTGLPVFDRLMLPPQPQEAG